MTTKEAAQAAWIAYRDDYMRKNYVNKRQASSQLRRREFIAGFMAALEVCGR